MENEQRKLYKEPLIMAEKTPYAIDCNSCHKKSFLSLKEYQKQLDDIKSDGFTCPSCASDDVSFDEVNYVKIMGVDRKGL